MTGKLAGEDAREDEDMKWPEDSKWWLLTRIVLWGVLAEAILLGMLWLLTTYAQMPPDWIPPHLCCWKGE